MTEQNDTKRGDERARDLERQAMAGDPVAAASFAAALNRASDSGRRYLPPIHKSAETAYVQEDYPYGRQLRCKRRVWVETKPKHGQRVVYQTQDPRNGRWNKPKAGTYHELVALYLDEDEHIQCDPIGIHGPESGEAGLDAWAARCAAALDEHARKHMVTLRAVRRAYSRITYTVTTAEPIDLSDRAALDKAADEQEKRQEHERKVIRAAIGNELAAINGRPLPVPSLGTAASVSGGDR
jgi:hypothetical protein